jgi:hypothetical protein
MTSTVPSISLVAEQSGVDHIYLVVGDSRFHLPAADFTALGFRGDRVRVVAPGTLTSFAERPLSAPAATRASQVFFDCGEDGAGPLGSWTYNCQPSSSLVQREVLVAGWLNAAHGESPPSPWVNIANNGIEDVHYDLVLDPVFVERMYGPGGLSLRMDGVRYFGNPPDVVPLAFAAGPPTQAGGPPSNTFNSWILPGSGDDIHGELNAWHTRDTAGWFQRHMVGRGPAPAGWVNPFGQDPDAFFPFHPMKPESESRALQAGDYVVMRGPLWQDRYHGDATEVLDPWDTGLTRHHAWLEMHPIDWVVRVRGPQANARVTVARRNLIADQAAGATAQFDESVPPSFAPSATGRSLHVRRVRALTDSRPGMTYSGPVQLRTTLRDDHVDIGATVTSGAAGQGRWHGSWLIEWSERDVHDAVWVDEDAPAGANELDAGEGWQWITDDPRPFQGLRAHLGPLTPGVHQHYFSGAPQNPQVASGDVLFATVWLDPDTPPEEIMLQWFAENWEHRAFWGGDLIPWGVSGTVSRTYRGPLPFSGEWVRLEVPAADVGLQDRAVSGLAFTAFGGRVVWDRAGVWSPPPSSGQIRAVVTPSRFVEGSRTITVHATDTGTQAKVSGRVVLDGADIGATNQPLTHWFEPGRAVLSILCAGYPAQSVSIQVTQDRKGGEFPDHSP